MLTPVHVAVRFPVKPLPHAPVQVPWNAVGLVQLLNVPLTGFEGMVVHVTACNTT